MTVTDADRIAEFMARKGVTQVAPGIAYGIDAEADKAKRLAARREREAFEIENAAERRMETVREAYHTGGRSAALRAMNGDD